MPALRVTSTARPHTRKPYERCPAVQCLGDVEGIAQLAITRGWRGLQQCLLGPAPIAPIHRLSRHILTDIFLLIPLESSSGRWSQGKFVRPSPHKAPMVFTHVCKAWREVAISIPALWSSIDVYLSDNMSQPVASSSFDCVDTWLRRSGNLPLSLGITVGKHPDEALPVLALFFCYVPRWQHIRWRIELDSALRRSPPFMVHQGPATRLESLEVSTVGFIGENLSIPLNSIMNSAPLLYQCSFIRLAPYCAPPRRTIHPPFSQLTHLGLEDFHSIDDCLEILRNSRKLVDCALDLGRLFEWSTSTSNRISVRLDGLRSLQIRTRSDLSNFLDHLTLPALSDIMIHFEPNLIHNNDTTWPQARFTSLISRSSCSLTRLHFKSVPLSEENLIQCLRRTTLSLRELHIEDGRPLTCVTDTVLRRLSHGGSSGQHGSLCPKLDTFIFGRCGLFTMDAFTNMLESRMSAAQTASPLPHHLRCVRPKRVEVAIIICRDRLEALRIQRLQLKIGILPA